MPAILDKTQLKDHSLILETCSDLYKRVRASKRYLNSDATPAMREDLQIMSAVQSVVGDPSITFSEYALTHPELCSRIKRSIHNLESNFPLEI